MKLYVYADESGVFDQKSGEPFVYGGVIVSSSNRQSAFRRYRGLEKTIRSEQPGLCSEMELKASILDMKTRSRVFRTLRGFGCFQFAAIVDQTRVYNTIYSNKKDKQKFLDYALKRAIKHGVLSLIHQGVFAKDEIDGLDVIVDEHSTSTSGRYDLEESINSEFRFGTYNPAWTEWFPPVFDEDFPEIPVTYVDSSKVALIRAADITANWVYRAERDKIKHPEVLESVESRVSIIRLP